MVVLHIQARSDVRVLASVGISFSCFVGQVMDNFRVVLNDLAQLWGQLIRFCWMEKQQQASSEGKAR